MDINNFTKKRFSIIHVLLFLIGISALLFYYFSDKLILDNKVGYPGNQTNLYNAPSPVLYDENSREHGQAKIENQYTYKNTLIGFTLIIPARWYIPSEVEITPTFYSCAEYVCEDGAIQIQRHDKNTEKAFDELFLELQKNHVKVTELNNLIKNASVIKTYIETDAEGESVPYAYYVLFYKDKKAFTILTNSDKLENSILRSFEVLQQEESI